MQAARKKAPEAPPKVGRVYHNGQEQLALLAKLGRKNITLLLPVTLDTVELDRSEWPVFFTPYSKGSGSVRPKRLIGIIKTATKRESRYRVALVKEVLESIRANPQDYKVN